MPSFDRIRYRRQDSSAFLYAFDLIELNGADLRRAPLEVRKATLANVLAGASQGIWFNDHIEGDGPTVFKHACKLGLEGIVSKRKESPYRSGRSSDWLKMDQVPEPSHGLRPSIGLEEQLPRSPRLLQRSISFAFITMARRTSVHRR